MERHLSYFHSQICLSKYLNFKSVRLCLGIKYLKNIYSFSLSFNITGHQSGQTKPIFSPGIPRPNDQGLRIALLVSVVSGVVILVMTVCFIVCCCQERMSKKKEKQRTGRSRLVTLIIKITLKIKFFDY